MHDAQQLRRSRDALLDLLRARIDVEAPTAVGPFVRRVLALSERIMRVSVVAERLRRLDAHLSLALLHGLLTRSEARDPAAQEVLLDLATSRPVAETLGYEHARLIYELARRRGQLRIARLFLSPDVQDEGVVQRRTSENQQLPDTSLGWRKQLARGDDRLKLDRLLFDRNPAVIEVLLDNPRIIERDVVRIAAMRPTNPELQHVIFSHRKWINRYRVKTALALNPATPLDISLALLAYLQLPQLRYAASNQTLHDEVQHKAEEILRARGATQDEPRGGVLVLTEDGRSALALDGGVLDVDLERMVKELENWQAD